MPQLRLVSSPARAEGAPSRDRASHPSLVAFEREFDWLIRTLRRLGVPRDDLEDLAHEVFLVLYQNWEAYDQTRPLRAYLFGIAFRIAANHSRKRRREAGRAVAEEQAGGPTPDRLVESYQARALVLRALEQVPLPRRSVLVLHDIDQLPMSEIAATLSIFRFTGYSRLRKARREFATAVTSLLGGAREP